MYYFQIVKSSKFLSMKEETRTSFIFLSSVLVCCKCIIDLKSAAGWCFQYSPCEFSHKTMFSLTLMLTRSENLASQVSKEFHLFWSVNYSCCYCVTNNRWWCFFIQYDRSEITGFFMKTLIYEIWFEILILRRFSMHSFVMFCL